MYLNAVGAVVGVNIKNIRTTIDEKGILELAQSIHADGQLVPIVVMIAEDEDGSPICELVCGARRLRAVQYILENIDEEWNSGEIRCTKYTGSVEDAELLNGLENIEREDVNPVDQCEWILRMIEEGGRTHRDTARTRSRVQEGTSGSKRSTTSTGRAGTLL